MTVHKDRFVQIVYLEKKGLPLAIRIRGHAERLFAITSLLDTSAILNIIDESFRGRYHVTQPIYVHK